MRIKGLTWSLAGVALVVAVILSVPRLAAAAGANAFGLRALRAVEAGPAVLPAHELAQLAPDASAAQRLVGMVALRQGNLALADEALGRALARDRSAVKMLRAARPDSARLAGVAYRLYPGDAAAAVWEGDVQEKAGQPGRALALYRVAVALAPGDNLTWEKVGLLAEQQEQRDVACQAYGRACDINPVRSGACYSAARLSYAAGDWSNTIHYYLAGGMPDRPQGWVSLIRSAQRLGRTADAERYLQLAGERNPADYGQLLQVDS